MPENPYPSQAERLAPSPFAVVRIKVGPRAGSWAVDLPGAEALAFASGAQAEAHAKSLAIALSRDGMDVVLAIHDLSGAEIATWRYFADDDDAMKPPPAQWVASAPWPSTQPGG